MSIYITSISTFRPTCIPLPSSFLWKKTLNVEVLYLSCKCQIFASFSLVKPRSIPNVRPFGAPLPPAVVQTPEVYHFFKKIDNHRNASGNLIRMEFPFYVFELSDWFGAIYLTGGIGTVSAFEVNTSYSETLRGFYIHFDSCHWYNRCLPLMQVFPIRIIENAPCLLLLTPFIGSQRPCAKYSLDFHNQVFLKPRQSRSGWTPVNRLD